MLERLWNWLLDHLLEKLEYLFVAGCVFLLVIVMDYHREFGEFSRETLALLGIAVLLFVLSSAAALKKPAPGMWQLFGITGIGFIGAIFYWRGSFWFLLYTIAAVLMALRVRVS